MALQVRDRLRALNTDPENPETRVPLEAQAFLPRFKAALVRTARAVIACQDAASPSKDMQSELASLLEGNPPQPTEAQPAQGLHDARYQEWEATTYGHNLLIEVSTYQPDLLTVEFTFHIACGDDTVLMVFQRDGNRWREALDWLAPAYTEVSGAFGDTFLKGFLQSPDGWRAVVAHGTPWCTSRFSNFKLDVLAPSSDPSRPRIVWHANRATSRGDYKDRLRTAGEIFEFRTNAPAFTPEEYERTVVYRYRLSGDTVQRIEPIATNGRGFVDEWLESPWDEAIAQTDDANRTALRAAFDRYGFRAPKNSDSFTEWRNGPVRACPEKNFQVEVDSTRKTIVPGKPGGDSRRLAPMFFRIRETGDGYQMRNVTSTPAPECSGPNLIPLAK